MAVTFNSPINYGSIWNSANNLFNSGVDAVDNFIDEKVVGFTLPEKGLAYTDGLEYFTDSNFYPKDQINNAGINSTDNKMTLPANTYANTQPWSPGLGSAPYSPNNITMQNGPPGTINAVATPYNGMDEQQNYENTYTGQNGNLNLFNSNQQINPAGTSSPDGMMTMPTNYLYPGEAIGIDGVPYRPSAGQNNNPSSYSYEPNQGGSAAASATPVADVLGTRQFNQRTPSGSVYAPDMSAYNNSSLFNYEGPGGVSEYTYGQGLPTDGAAYSIFGSPADAANPYFAGQFATPTGPADAAINMNPVVMPAGVPAISGGSGNTFTQGSSGVTPRPGGLGLTQQQAAQAMSQAGQDLTYQQTIDEMGIFGPNNPAPSTLFPSPGSSTPEGLTDSGGGGRAIVPWINSKTGEIFYAPHTGFKANNSDWKIASTMDNQLQQGQINKNKEIANIASSPDTSIFNPNEQINNAGVSSPDGMMTMPTQPTDMQNYMDDSQFAPDGMMTMPTQPTDMQNYMDDSQFASGVTDRTAQILAQAEANGGVIDDTEVVTSNAGIDAFRESLLRDPSLDREPQNVYGGLDGMFGPYGLHNNEPEGIFAGMPPERNFAKADEIDISTPFVPEGVEGEDYYQDVTGDYFAMEDDLGTQALGPPSGMDARFLNKETGTGDALPQAVLPRIEPFQPPRPNNDMTFGQAGRTAYDGRSSYEREGTEELTSGDMGALDDAMTAIDAKYAGSTTTASQQAELSEIVNSIAMAYGNDAGRENAALAREQQNMKQANATSYIPSYAREDEGTSTGESLFQGVAPVAPTNTGYPGANSTPFNPSNPIDQVVLQQIAQDAQIARAKYEAPAPAPVSVPTANAASLFNYGPPNMQQVKPMVAKTQNNMTVPVMRDARMDRRYGGPYGF